MNSMDKTNRFPYLLAIGEKKTEIKCFYLAFEEQILLVIEYNSIH